MKTLSSHDAFKAWVPYAPRLLFRDLIPVADPHNATDLRARDLEIFEANGMFCRRPLPGEFAADATARLDSSSFIVVEFSGNRWERQLGKRNGIPQPLSLSIRRRRRFAGRRRV